MKKVLFYVLGGVFTLCVANACHDDDPDIPQATIDTNEWIYENMDAYYYWNDLLPKSNPNQPDPEEYFHKLLYTKDTLSWITDDYASLAAEYNGNPVTMGYDPAFYAFSDGETVFIVVNYVYPGSVAEEEGLKRGDIILSINNTKLNTTNYYDLYSGTTYSVQLGKATANGNNITISETGESLDLTARITTNDPSVYHEIFNVSGYKIGYLVYVSFVAGDNDVFLNKLDQIFAEFKSEGISDLIVDLRYNPGGDLVAAGHLASEIAPAAIVSTQAVVVNLNYNDDYQAFLENDPRYADELSYKFSQLASNINMQKVYFLTTKGTASASELVITGLEPYMDVIQIGEPTYGKYSGAYILPDENNEWAIIPIVMKYSNAAGYTDFEDGLEPDYAMNDDVIFAVPFGDTADPMTQKAIELITGQTMSILATRSKPALVNQFKKITPENKVMNLRRNLYVPVSPEMKKLLR